VCARPNPALTAGMGEFRSQRIPGLYRKETTDDDLARNGRQLGSPRMRVAGAEPVVECAGLDLQQECYGGPHFAIHSVHLR
jgi:hypothetical protein